MKNFKLSTTTLTELGRLIRELLSLDPKKHYYVNITEKAKKRSLSANAQQHVWYNKISEFTGTDLKTVVSECKIDFGVPIVLRDPEIGRTLGYALERAGFFSMQREKQVKFMSVIQITSLMNTVQHNQYRENLIYYWNQNGLDLGYLEKEK